MKTNRLTRFQTLVLLLVGLLVSTGIVAPRVALGMESNPLEGLLGRTLSMCDTQISEFNKARSDFVGACQALGLGTSFDACLKDPKRKELGTKCSGGRRELDDALGALSGQDDDESDYRDFKDNICPKIAQLRTDRCLNEIPYDSESAAKDEKENRAILREYRDELNKAKKEANEKQEERQKEITRLNDDARQADKDYAEQVMNINKEIKKTKADAENEKMKTVSETKRKMDEIDVEYIKMRDRARRLESTRQILNSSWTLQCRVHADVTAQEQEREFEKRMLEERKIIKNFAFSNASGRMNRLMKKKVRKIADKYTEAYNKCLQGVRGPGAEIKSKLMAADREQADTQKMAEDQTARLERIRLEAIDTMQKVIASLDKQTQDNVLMLSQQLQQAQINHQQDMNANRMQQAQAQAAMQQGNKDSADLIAGIQEKIDNVLKDGTAESAIRLCKSGLPTKAEREAVTKSSSELFKALEMMNSQCAYFVDDKNSCTRFNTECQLINEANPTPTPAPTRTPAPATPASPPAVTAS